MYGELGYAIKEFESWRTFGGGGGMQEKRSNFEEAENNAFAA